MVDHKKRIRWNIELVRQEVNKKGVSTILSKEYVANHKNLKFKCNCGTEFERTLPEFLTSSGKCKPCGRQALYDRSRKDINEIKDYITKNGATLLSNFYKDKYTQLEIKCQCGTKFTRDWGALSRSHKNTIPGIFCTPCSLKNGQQYKKATITEVQELLESKGCKLLTKEYTGSTQQLDILCKCGETFQRPFGPIKNSKQYYCRDCAYIEMGKNTSKKVSLQKAVSYFKSYGITLKSPEKFTSIFADLNLQCRCGRNFTKSYWLVYQSRHKSCNLCTTQESLEEKQIKNFLIENGVNNIIEKDRTLIKPKEIDLYLPDHKIGIEINGLFHHGQKSGKPRTYHLSKTRSAAKKDVNLIHITDREWHDKHDQIKGLLFSRVGKGKKIYARKCTIKEVNKPEAKEFINTNHLQGWTNSDVQLGLYYKEELVCLMTFGKSRFNKKYQYELIRFCCKINTVIVGGSDRLFKYFIKKYSPKNIISYCDISKFTGAMYLKLGFTFSHYSKPNYFYFKGRDIFSRIKFQKHKQKELFKNFNPKLSEWENMLNNGYDRYWDCGNNVYSWEQK